MWRMEAVTWRAVDPSSDGAQIIQERILADTLDSLILQCQNWMDNRNGLFMFWPDYLNPEIPLEHYADLLGQDITWSRDQTITGHFATWVRNGRIIVHPLYALKRDAKYRAAD